MLKKRGLTIGDEVAAEHALEHIGYYRLSGYALPFQKQGQGTDRHSFKPNTTFEAILDRYIFDRKLRLLLMDAIERIEIAVRAALTNTLAPIHTPHWYTQPSLFRPHFRHLDFIVDIKRQIGHTPRNPKRQDVYIEHYFRTYNHPELPPSWMVFESVAFGTVSLTYANLQPHNAAAVSSSLGKHHQSLLASWLHAINYVRNLCAHHARLWNRVCGIKPMTPRKGALALELEKNDRLYAQLVVMQTLLCAVAPDNHWAQRLRSLLAEHPNVPLASMGIPPGWHSRSTWTR